MKTLFNLLVIVIGVLVLSACGGSKPITLADVPGYTGATELKADDSRLATTLANNGAQNAQLAKAAGVNSKLEQKGFALPAGATWDAVVSFYNDKLKTAGFSEGIKTGGIGGQAAQNLVNSALAMTNQANDLFKTTIYSKDKQTLTVIMLSDLTDANQKTLVLSLNTN